jgi:D-sedoheptulose 7-phosphate isomerase
MSESTEQRIYQRLAEAQTVFGSLGKEFAQTVASAAEITSAGLKAGGAVYFVGNGGSAADAQHWAAELVGRYLHDHTPLNAHALTVNSSVMTALGNDFPADEIFSRQVQAHLRAGDVLVAISTSGNSENILRAIATAANLGASVIGVTGKGGGKMAEICDLTFIAPSDDTPRIQEAHLFFGHCFCELVEQAFLD